MEQGIWCVCKVTGAIFFSLADRCSIDSDILHLRAAGNDIVILNSFKVASDLFEKKSSIYSSRCVRDHAFNRVYLTDNTVPSSHSLANCKRFLHSNCSFCLFVKFTYLAWVGAGSCRPWSMVIHGRNVDVFSKNTSIREMRRCTSLGRWNLSAR